MKIVNVWLPDSVHAIVEKLTNPMRSERDVLDIEKNILLYMEDSLNNKIKLFAINSGRTGETRVGYKKEILLKILLISYFKAWQQRDINWQAAEFRELKLICILMLSKINKIRKGKNIGGYKITKQLLLSAILHRIVSTQDLKAFFEKTL